MKFPNLFRKIAQYNSSIKSITITKNSDPFLQQLSKEKSFKKRIEMAKSLFDELGEGSSRMVFELPENKVLKLAINDKGIEQNLFEARPELQTECTNKISMADPEGKWLIVNKAEELTEKKFKQLIGISFSEFTDALFYKFNNESNAKKPKDYEKIVKLPLFECIMDMMSGPNDLQLGDLYRLSSWGLVNDKVVLIDAGLSKDIYKNLY